MSQPIHVVCPHCNATNRIPAARLEEAPRCGKCHQSLFTGQPLEVSSGSFGKHLGNDELPLLVDFWAPWCGPCRMMAPAYEQAAAGLEPRFRLLKVNTESEPQLGARFNIRSIPTLALFHKGREIARQAGAMGAADIQSWAETHHLACQ